jgi:chromosomal replication initiation ATPase DnaA
MRTIVRNSGDVKSAVEKLWEERSALVAENIRRYPTIAILGAIAAAHQTTIEDLRSRERTMPLCMARHHAVWEMRRRRIDLGFQQIAAELDRSDHATAMHSWNVFKRKVREGQFVRERTIVAKLLGDDV